MTTSAPSERSRLSEKLRDLHGEAARNAGGAKHEDSLSLSRAEVLGERQP